MKNMNYFSSYLVAACYLASICTGFTRVQTLRFSKLQPQHNFEGSPLFATVEGGSTSLEYALSPDSDEAKELIKQKLGITDEKIYDKLTALAELVVEWNERLNLISRKDCSVDVVFGRHILPSIALTGVQGWSKSGDICSIFKEISEDNHESEELQNLKVVDIGTGGGFPGLPLAIIHPEIQFTLVDSVGKKLRAIDEMADELGIDNVSTYHGRAEEMIDLYPNNFKNQFNICVGRSVAALPKFCFWINGLLKNESGKLLYIIGGELENIVEDNILVDVEISELLGSEDKGYSDKRALLFGESDVKLIAVNSGETKQKRGKPGTGRHRKKSISKKVKRDNSAPKQRGAENFRRYSVN